MSRDKPTFTDDRGHKHELQPDGTLEKVEEKGGLISNIIENAVKTAVDVAMPSNSSGNKR
jgi:hypothetical protein